MIMKRIAYLIVAVLYLVSARPRLERYTAAFWGSFDTFFVITAYCESKPLFDAALMAAADSFSEMDKLYNRFEYSPEIVNVAYINRHAYENKIVTEDELFSLLQYGIMGAERTGRKVSPAFGAVSSVWYDEIKKGRGAKPPSQEKLQTAAAHTSLDLLELDEKNKTIKLLSDMALIDAGAFAKGYAVERVSHMLAQMGINRAAISGGGNIKVLAPPDWERYWKIGIQNPDGAIFENSKAEISVKLVNQAVATSGDYQRYFWHEGKRYHHLIDPKTLYPADHFRSVTVVTDSAADADLFSTALFVSNLESGKRMAQQEGLAVLWIKDKSEKECNESMKKIIAK